LLKNIQINEKSSSQHLKMLLDISNGFLPSRLCARKVTGNLCPWWMLRS